MRTKLPGGTTRRKVDTKIERKLLTGMIVSDEFLKRIQEIYKPQYLTSPFARTVAQWCMEYGRQYGKAPGISHFTDIYNDHKDGLDDEQDNLICTMLESIDGEYKKSDGFNADYVLDKARGYFTQRCHEEARSALRNGKQADAEEWLERAKLIESGGSSLLVELPTVRVRPVIWLWEHRLPLGMVTILDGDPGQGKSTLALDLAARISRGAPMPGEKFGTSKPGGVLILSAEDDVARTIVPRLKAAEADLDHIKAWSMEKLPTFPADIANVRAMVKQIDARLIIVDPLMAFLDGRTDAYKDSDMRRVLRPFTVLAGETGAAVLIIRHLNKSTTQTNPLYRGGGSIGIIGAARMGLLAAPDPFFPGDDRRHILAVTKSNLGPKPQAFVYQTEEAAIVERKNVIQTSKIEWGNLIDISTAELLNIPGKRHTETSHAEETIREIFAEAGKKEIPSKDIEEQLQEAGFSWNTMSRAKGNLGIISKKLRGGWTWLWPKEKSLSVLDPRGNNGSGTHEDEENNKTSMKHRLNNIIGRSGRA